MEGSIENGRKARLVGCNVGRFYFDAERKRERSKVGPSSLPQENAKYSERRGTFD
jgi:hypothetical protein